MTLHQVASHSCLCYAIQHLWVNIPINFIEVHGYGMQTSERHANLACRTPLTGCPVLTAQFRYLNLTCKLESLNYIAKARTALNGFILRYNSPAITHPCAQELVERCGHLQWLAAAGMAHQPEAPTTRLSVQKEDADFFGLYIVTGLWLRPTV